MTGPNTGLGEPSLGGPTQEAVQRRLFAAVASAVPTDSATAPVLGLHTVDSSTSPCYTSNKASLLLVRGQIWDATHTRYIERTGTMKTLLESIRRLTPRKKLVVGLLLLIIVLTWLGVCAILGSYLV